MNKNWIDISAADKLRKDDVIGVEAEGKELAIYSVEGQVYASDNLCTHGHASLCDGYLDGYEIECPLHQGRFDIRDGKPLCQPAVEAIRIYPVKIENGRVLIDLA